MVTYDLPEGRQPAGFSPAVWRRLSGAFRGVRGVPSRASVGVRWVTPVVMRKLNRIHAGHDYVTDVLSFSAGEDGSFPHPEKKRERELGDLVICVPYATREAKRRMIEPLEELVRLVVHGTLHLSGMDHRTLNEEQKMFSLQEKIVERVMR